MISPLGNKGLIRVSINNYYYQKAIAIFVILQAQEYCHGLISAIITVDKQTQCNVSTDRQCLY